jgi:hypothetical protein
MNISATLLAISPTQNQNMLALFFRRGAVVGTVSPAV